MTIQNRLTQFLREERARKLDAIEFLEAGNIGFCEHQGDAMVEVSNEGIRIYRRHVSEIEKLLDEAGVAFDA